MHITTPQRFSKRATAHAVQESNFQLQRHKRCHDCKNYPLPQDRTYPMLKYRRQLLFSSKTANTKILSKNTNGTL